MSTISTPCRCSRMRSCATMTSVITSGRDHHRGWTGEDKRDVFLHALVHHPPVMRPLSTAFFMTPLHTSLMA